MLKWMRDTSKSLHWILWCVIASFLLLIVVQWGAGGGGQRVGERAWAAKVGGIVVSQDEFQQAFANRENQLRNLLGAQYDRARFMDADAILDGLIDNAMLRAEAKRQGLSGSRKEVARLIKSSPAFQGDDGRFSETAYLGYLSQNALRPASLDRVLAAGIVVDKMDAIFRASSSVTTAEVTEAWHRSRDSVSFEHVLVAPDAGSKAITVSEAELAARHAEAPEAYDAGEGREVRVATFDRQAFQSALENEAEMRSYYDQYGSSLYVMGNDQRRARVIRIAVDPQATPEQRARLRTKADDLARQAKRKGADFAELARQQSDDATTRDSGGDTGPFYRGSHEPAIDEAAFNMKEGDVRGPIETDYGFEILQLTKGSGEKFRTFDEVRDLVARALYAAQAGEAQATALATFRAALGEGKEFADAAAAAAVPVAGPTWVTRRGALPEGWSESERQAAFTTAVGEVSSDALIDGGVAVLRVLQARETSPLSLAEAREQVERDVRQAKARSLAEAAARATLAALRPGGTLADAAPGMDVKTDGPLHRRESIPGLPGSTDVVEAAFAAAVGTGGVVMTPSGPVAFRVTESVDADPTEDPKAFAAERQRLEFENYSALRRACLDALREAYEKDGKIKINADVLAPFQPAPVG